MGRADTIHGVACGAPDTIRLRISDSIADSIRKLPDTIADLIPSPSSRRKPDPGRRLKGRGLEARCQAGWPAPTHWAQPARIEELTGNMLLGRQVSPQPLAEMAKGRRSGLDFKNPQPM